MEPGARLALALPWFPAELAPVCLVSVSWAFAKVIIFSVLPSAFLTYGCSCYRTSCLGCMCWPVCPLSCWIFPARLRQALWQSFVGLVDFTLRLIYSSGISRWSFYFWALVVWEPTDLIAYEYHNYPGMRYFSWIGDLVTRSLWWPMASLLPWSPAILAVCSHHQKDALLPGWPSIVLSSIP